MHPQTPLTPCAPSDKAAVNQLMEKVDEAIKLLSDYTTRVEAEVKEREDIQELLDAYIWQQKHLLRDTKKKMKVRSHFLGVGG